MKKLCFILIATMPLLLSGCLVTKVVTVPLRATGAVISVVPVAGNLIDGAIDTAADGIDKVPL